MIQQYNARKQEEIQEDIDQRVLTRWNHRHWITGMLRSDFFQLTAEEWAKVCIAQFFIKYHAYTSCRRKTSTKYGTPRGTTFSIKVRTQRWSRTWRKRFAMLSGTGGVTRRLSRIGRNDIIAIGQRMRRRQGSLVTMSLDMLRITSTRAMMTARVALMYPLSMCRMNLTSQDVC
jgi:hypothetical protein